MRKDISPILNTKILGKTMISLLLFGIIWALITYHIEVNYTMFFVLAGIFNWAMLLTSWSSLKKMGRGLTVDETGQEVHPEETYA
jgi:hypothetical protein